MTDPLSISAGVAGLINLATAVTQACYSMYREIKKAPRMLKDVIDELGLLRQVLVDLNNICEQRSEPLIPLENVLKDIQDCGNRLEIFKSRLGIKYSNPGSIVSRIRWSYGGSEIRAFVDQMQNYRGMFESAKTNATLKLAMAIRNDVRSESVLQDLTRKEARLRSILEWLSPLDFSERQHDFYDTRREPGTSEWIENEEIFIQWRDHVVPYSNDYKRTLWCHGHPGSGKTIACSVLINHLLQLPGDIAVAYMYCFGQDQAAQTAEALVGSLIKQMVLRKISEGRVPNVVEDLYQKIGFHGRPSLDTLVTLLRSVTELFAQVFIVVDGIDEVERDTFNKLLDGALEMIRHNRTKFLISSRPSDSRISRYLEAGFKISVKASEADVREYLTRQIARSESLEMLIGNDPLFIKDTILEISQQCQGQFALAYLQLRRISEETNKAAIVAQLEHPAESLKEEYKKGLARIKKLPSPQYRLALSTMNYMARSKVLLRPEELQDALSIEPDNFTRNMDRWPPLAMILTVCLGFIIENPVSGKMEFFHITLSEFLTTSDIWHDLKLEFGGCCVTYLMSEDFKQPCFSQEEAVERRRQHPFAAYASRFWGDNVRGELEWKYGDVLLRFLTSDNKISCLQLLPPDTAYDTQLIGEPSELYQGVANSNSFAIYSCAYLRLKNVMPLLLRNSFEPDYVAPFGQRFSPLHIAVKLRDPQMCQWLIQAGANVNVQDKTGRTPLHLCWGRADVAVWEISPLLVDAGARFDITDSSGQTILHHALQHSGSFWVHRMVNTYHGFEVGKQDMDGNTALHYAVMRRYHDVIALLLNQNANPVLKNNNGQNPLTLAMESYDQGSERIVKQILACIDEEGAVHGFLTEERAAADTYLATCAERKASAKQAQAESDVEKSKKRSRFGQKSLQPITWEAEQEDPHDLSGLLLQGMRINFIDTASGMTPLHHAVLAGHELPTWHLLAAGAKADVKDQKYGLTPPELAQREGHLDVAALFLHSCSESPEEGFLWQRKSYQVGRGMWSKHLSGTELQRAYSEANYLRDCIKMCSVWFGPGMQIWYDYLGYEQTARKSMDYSSFQDYGEDDYNYSGCSCLGRCCYQKICS